MTACDESLLPLARAAERSGLSYTTLYGAGLRGHIRLRRLGAGSWSRSVTWRRSRRGWAKRQPRIQCGGNRTDE